MMHFWLFFSGMYPLYSGVMSMMAAQLIKIFFSYLRSGKLEFRYLFSSGGMPSTHSAMVVGLATAIGLKDGFLSSLFCLASVFAAIVMYDSTGVRRSVGQQAEILNQFIDDLVKKGEIKYERISEFLGHTPFEVLIGAMLGIGMAFALFSA